MHLRKVGANETLLTLGNGTEVLFSYNTPVAGYQRGEGYFRTAEHYSRTTSKHINKYLGSYSYRTVPQAAIDLLLAVSESQLFVVFS